MASPLGRYAAPAAAVASLGLIGAYVFALVLTKPLGLEPESLAPLHDLAILAAGALFGSAVAVNGYKAPLEAAHHRLDALGAPPADGPAE